MSTGYIAPARQLCHGSNRIVADEPKVCPICGGKVNLSEQRNAYRDALTGELNPGWVIASHFPGRRPAVYGVLAKAQARSEARKRRRSG